MITQENLMNKEIELRIIGVETKPREISEQEVKVIAEAITMPENCSDDIANESVNVVELNEAINVNRVIELESIFEKYNKIAEQYDISIDKGKYWHYAPENLKEMIEMIKKQLQELEALDEEYRGQFFCMGDSHPCYEKYKKKTNSAIEKLNAIIEAKSEMLGE